MKDQRGYSLAELLTVVAIIGVFSLISIPSFVNYSRSAKVRTATRQFNSDLRAARARAISRSNPVAVSFAAGQAPTFARVGEYAIYDQRIDTSTNPPSIVWDQVGRTRYLPESVYFLDSHFNVDDAKDDQFHDVIFLANGTVGNMPGSGESPNVAFKSRYKVTNNHVTNAFTASGSFKSTLTTDAANY